MKKLLFLVLLPWSLMAMRKSPSMYNFQAQGDHIEIYKIPHESWTPECSYCKRVATYVVVSFKEFRFNYCTEHFRAAGYSPTSIKTTDN